jgi:hypothetical protein
MATLIRTNGIENKITPKNPAGGFTAEEIRSLLRGTFQLLPLDLERTILMIAYPSESRSPANDRATKLFVPALAFRKSPASEIRILRGDILVAAYSELRLPEVVASATPVI